MFPADPVAAAPAILNTLEQVFPVDPGSIVIGPMVEVGWGRPVSFLTAQLGVILSLPDPRIVIIGRVRIALPAPDLPIVDLRATIYGEITPDHLLILVSLRGSRIAGFTVTGDIGMLLRWAGSAEFAITAGGFHPRYDPPRELAGMQRLGMDLSPPAILSCEPSPTSRSPPTASSSAPAWRWAPTSEWPASAATSPSTRSCCGRPAFLFMIDLGIGLTVRAMGVTLCGVSVQLHLEGPAPWRAEGHAEVEILWWDIPVDVGPFTWGDDDNPPPLPADPRQLVRDALHRNPGAWQALTPPDADRVVRLVPAPPSDTDVTVHPMGLFDVRQHAVPLETTITRVGANPVPEGQRRVHLGVPKANGTDSGRAERGAPTSSPPATSSTSRTTRSCPGRASSRCPRARGCARPARTRRSTSPGGVELRYETFVCDDPPTRPATGRSVDVLMGERGGAGPGVRRRRASDLRARTRYAIAPDPIVLADPGEAIAGVQGNASTAAADSRFDDLHPGRREARSDATEQLARAGVG